MGVTRIEQGWMEPTVFGAVRRFWVMVLAVAVLAAVAAVGYTLVTPEEYRADATVTVPPTSQAQGDTSNQYLDSQVLLLQSQEVAARAAQIAAAALSQGRLVPEDFLPSSGRLTITPPEGGNPGSFGSSVISVSFTADDPKVAQVGANAVLQAFDDTRAAAITAEGEAAVAAIEKTFRDTRTRGQLSDLVNKRTETLLNQQLDVARHPTFRWAAVPLAPVNDNSKRSGAVGLVVGVMAGVALAYARALRRHSVWDPDAAGRIYDAPLIAEVATPKVSAVHAARAPALTVVAAPDSMDAESYRMAAGHLDTVRVARDDALTVAAVATSPGEQKSVVLANLALAAAERGTSVLAVDADAGALTSLLLPDTRLDGTERLPDDGRPLQDRLRPSEVDSRVTVLPAGGPGTRPGSSVAHTDAVGSLVSTASRSYDLVLIDSPPLLTRAEAGELVAKAGAAVVLVGRDDRLSEHLRTADRLELVGCEVLGYLYGTVRRGPWSARRFQDRGRAALQRRPGLVGAVPSWD